MPDPRARDASIVAALRRRLTHADAVSLSNFAWFAARRGAHEAALDAARRSVALPGAPRAAWRGLERLATGHADGMLLAAGGHERSDVVAAGNPLAAAVAAHRQMESAVAEACYRAALDRADLAGGGWNGLAVLHEQRHERGDADLAWENAAATGSVAGAHNQALAMLRRGFPHRARTALAPWLVRCDPPGAIRFLAGYAALCDQDPAGAIPLLLSAVAADVDSARAHFTLGLACEQLRRHADALAAIRRALLLSPRYVPEVWLLDRGDGTPPVELPVDAGATANPSHPSDAMLSLGRSLLQNANLGEALAVFDQVVVERPSQPAALFHRGVVLAKLRRYDEALEDWEGAGRAEPDGQLADASRRHARSARRLATLFPAP